MKRRMMEACMALTCAGALALSGMPTAASEKTVAETEDFAVAEEGRTGTDQPRQVMVSATGTALAVPDKAELTVSVSSQQADAEAAQTENTGKVNAVTEALTSLGIEEGSIQTSDYSVSPQYDYDKSPAEVTGYQVRTSLTVSDLQIEEAGKILSACVKAGVNEVDGLTYTCSTYDERYQEALQKAVREARRKADTLAEAVGRTVGEASFVQEGYQDLSARYESASRNGVVMDMAETAQSMDVSPDLSAGSMRIQAHVTISYELTGSQKEEEGTGSEDA